MSRPRLVQSQIVTVRLEHSGEVVQLPRADLEGRNLTQITGTYTVTRRAVGVIAKRAAQREAAEERKRLKVRKVRATKTCSA